MVGRRCAALCLLSLVLLAAAVACGGDDDDDVDPTPTATETASPTPEAQPQTFVVHAGFAADEIVVRAFSPAEVTIRVGDSVTWEAAAGEHTVSFVADAEPFPLIVPDPASPADVILNPRVVDPDPDPLPSEFDEGVPLNSGLFGGDFGAEPSLTFARAGSLRLSLPGASAHGRHDQRR